MKTARNLILIALIALSAALSGYFFYYTYRAYQYYQVAQNSDKYVILTQYLNTLLQKIEQERALGSVYLGYRGKIDFNQLRITREQTDTALESVKQYIQQYPQFASSLTNIQSLRSNLQYVRSRVDVISSDYKDILIAYYQEEISQSLLKEILGYTKDLSMGLETLKPYLKTYSNLIVARNLTNEEKSFIAYIISVPQKMHKEDLLEWETILEANKTPWITLQQDPKTQKLITKLLDTAHLSQLSLEARIPIVKGAIKGHYNLSIASWFEKMDKKSHQITTAQERIYKHLLSQTTDISISPSQIVTNVAIALFLLILAILGMLLLQKKPKRKEQTPSAVIGTKKEKEQVFKKPSIQEQLQSPKEPTPSQPRDLNEHLAIATETLEAALPTTNIIPSKKVKKALKVKEEEELPLSNLGNGDIVLKGETKPSTKKDSATLHESVFNPMQEFVSTIRHFLAQASKRHIELNYYIDPTIPTACLADTQKVHDILLIIVNYISSIAPERSMVLVRIEDIAATKLESAVKLHIDVAKVSFTPEEIKAILNARYVIDVPNKISRECRDLKLVSQLLHLIGGDLKIKANEKGGTTFLVTMNFKKIEG